VTVRNCRVRGFLNGIKVTRDGFRTLAAGAEYVHGTSEVAIEDDDVRDTRGVGIFVDGYVSGVTIARTHVEGAGSSGIYLDGGSRGNAVLDNEIVGNGFRENGPGGQQFTLGGTTYWFWGVGREGLSLDGSSDNLVEGNRFEGNSAGGLFVYKNCGEFPDSGRYFERRTPSERNQVVDNDFVGGRNGVWIGSRMAENTLPMACTDPAYIDEPTRRVVLDRAPDNAVVGNRFHDVTYGVRVEDDDTTVAANTFTAPSADHHAVIIGTPLRTEVLHRPVRGTRLLDNRSHIVGNDGPYRWTAGEADTTVSGNRALGHAVGICEAPPVPRQAFIFVIAVQAADPSGAKPPTPDLTVATLGALPACARRSPPTATTTTTTTTAAGAVPPAAPARPVGGGPAYTG
jgi:parallel beta-helix repeat protein